MALKLECGYLKGFIGEHEYAAMASQVESAHALLASGKGPGNDFLGWVDLPTNYDKEEFARIKAAAERIKKNTDVFIVIGIGGSYLGARAAIEFLKSEHYNALKKDTPDIYFTGNSISSTALAELVEICEGKDISINMISKSGTTTEPAIAFRVFREILEKKYGKEDFYKEHPCFYLYTKDGVWQYDIFSVRVVDELSDSYTMTFASTDAYRSYLDQAVRKSMYDTTATAEVTDSHITQATCTSKDTDRLIVQAVKGEQIR